MKKKGISLILLIITIIVVIIIAGVVILNLGNSGALDQSKKAKFMSDYRVVQEGINLYSLSKYDEVNQKFELPLNGYLTLEDKTYIKTSVPTLNSKIEELSGSIDTANLAWINSNDINVKLSNEKQEKGYILDVTTGQLYDYVGDYFEGKRWHTLDGGVLSDGTIPDNTSVVTEELWDGWIKLTLYYPAGSTEKKWRLGTEGEVRVDPMLMWQDYSGAITIPLDRVKDVWIKYIIDNKEVIIPPVGTLLVDIVPDKIGTTKVSQVNVKINFDEGATTKEYRVGDSGWITYNGQFSVTENCMIEARAKKTETIYNADGTILATRDVSGRDLVYIGNIGIDIAQIEDSNLVAPTITRLPAVGSEKARVQVVYPANADRKIYKVNYGIEQNYTSEINVTNYGTYIVAYYYDSTGKRSRAVSIVINDTSTGAAAELPTSYDPKPPYVPGDPVPPYEPGIYGKNIIAPTINISPSTLVEEVGVSIIAPANADKVYIKLGRYAEYQEYTSPITVRQNMEVYAYYKTYTGERSITGYGVVSNIKKTNKPYVYINANPYPWGGSYEADNVTITIAYSDTNTIEYSEDGIVYQPYTGPFVVTENKRIYARGTNTYGVTDTSLNVTNIGKLNAPIPTINLAVNINVNPEPVLSTTRVATASVTIDYDAKATEKYYSIGRYGTLQTYTGQFDVTSSCTIYAYAKSTNSQGQTSKTIDNISSGISEPIIIAIPTNSVQASKVSLTIEYDKYATIKRYSIDSGPLRDYVGAFEVTKNGSTIYAYSQNALGQYSEASYTIENIIPEPPILMIDKGNYYLLKLNYPPSSKGREYKWKIDGVWNGYKDAGILLIKPQFKDQLIQNGTLVKIEDDNGNMITFTGDYYFIDVPISELFENLFMRWDREPLSAPQILITPTEPAMQVTANIVYNSSLITKQYKVIKPGEISSSWIDYTGPITIDKNNTIYAKGMDETEVWSAEGMLKVTNIDENSPVIKLTADLIAAQQKVAVKVNVTDDVAVGKVKWVEGIQGESYFVNSGTEITNDSIVNITSNGYYTFYAEDKVGNKQVYTLNVTNVDLTPPVIDIQVSPENVVGLTANVTINYGDSTIKQYKIGTSNAIWTNYTTIFEISSYTILSNNWQNSDGTVTIYAKGKDSSGNEITVEKKVLSLDLDKPILPVINSNAGYPILTGSGVKYDAITTITYDTRTDIDNYYSLDLGVTWIPYTVQFNLASGTVIAKSIKKSSGLEVSISQTIGMPADALKLPAYDNNDTTSVAGAGSYYLQVDSSMVGNKIRVRWYSVSYSNGDPMYIRFLDTNKTEISFVTRKYGTFDDMYVIPANTKWIKYQATGDNKLYEIQPSNEPTFTAINGYMSLTADPTKAIKEPYQMVTVTYFATSTQRLYRIGTTGEWLNYTDQPVKVNHGQTIYTKGIDQYGVETRIVSSYTVNVLDGLKSPAYDGNDATGMSGSGSYYMDVDNSMVGSKIRVKWYSYAYSNGYPVYLRFLNDSNQEISFVTRNYGNFDDMYTIPLNTKRIKYDSSSVNNNIYEIQPSNEPTFSATNGYMLLNADPTKAIKEPYQMVTLNYFATSVQRLYRIGIVGEWLNYNDQPIWVNQGQTIYTKGIDRYGNETRIISSYTAIVSDAIAKEALDGNDSTYISTNNTLLQVDNSMQGKSIRVKWNGGYVSGGNSYYAYLRFLDDNKQVISSVSTFGATISDGVYTLPSNAKWIKFEITSFGGKIYEIGPSNEPTFSAINGYMSLTADPTKAIRNPYQIVTVSYFATSVQRLYRIGTVGEWLNYADQPIKVDQGQTIYTKGIDQYGNETRIISSYTSNSTDAIKSPAYDNNDTTYMNESNTYMEVDSSMQNKNIRVRWKGGTYSGNPRVVNLVFMDDARVEISRITSLGGSTASEGIYTIPANTKFIRYVPALVGYSYDNALYEIQPSNEPTISATNGYMLLIDDTAKAIKNPYQMITITYFVTSVQRLYSIGTTSNWVSYNDQPIKVDQGQIIYAKGIDQYGNETRIISSYTSNSVDAIKSAAYDNNNATYMNEANTFMEVDSSMQNKNIRVRWKGGTYSGNPRVVYLVFMNDARVEISRITSPGGSTVSEGVFIIPANTKWIKYIPALVGYSYDQSLYEIQPSP